MELSTILGPAATLVGILTSGCLIGIGILNTRNLERRRATLKHFHEERQKLDFIKWSNKASYRFAQFRQLQDTDAQTRYLDAYRNEAENHAELILDFYENLCIGLINHVYEARLVYRTDPAAIVRTWHDAEALVAALRTVPGEKNYIHLEAVAKAFEKGGTWRTIKRRLAAERRYLVSKYFDQPVPRVERNSENPC